MTSSSTPTALDLTQLFPFELDDFQKQAIAALDAGQSAVVCVPTGSGKTLVGEYAIHRALATGKRVFYTTPLKALSNQKFRDFREQFGEERVGLLTGDNSHNRDAPILVMTTEIFRNMLYGTPIGQVGASLEGVEVVVLDECHYMNDSQRGTVWEESIIYCPPKVQLVALSATIANADQLTAWISEIHGPTLLIQSDFRPVPLEFYFSTRKGLFPLLDDAHEHLNPQLKPKRRRGSRRRLRRDECPSVGEVVSQMQAREMLPAIFFIFSRRGCDRAVEQMGELSLVNEAEAETLRQRVGDFLQRNPDAGRSGQVEPLQRGIAAHHAGILPAWKALVEELFQAGLIKVVFATETLAAGINMPARTTVISAISKRTDRGHRLLTASEFLQMAGRAGRRGMDPRGHVVTVETPFEGAKDAASLALKPADPLRSQFAPTYGMVLNLLQTHSVDEVKNLLERSFAQYVSGLHSRPEQAAIAELTMELAKLDVELASVPEALFAEYQKLSERLKEERRLLRTLEQQSREESARSVAKAVGDLNPGTAIFLKGRHVPGSRILAALLVEHKPGVGSRSGALICLTADNRWLAVTRRDAIAIDSNTHFSEADLETIDPPAPVADQLGVPYPGDPTTARLAGRLPSNGKAAMGPPPEVRAQQERLSAVQTEHDHHALQQWGKPGKLLKRYQQRQTLRLELQERRSRYQDYQTTHWREFMNLVKVLREFDALTEFEPTVLGQAAAAIRGDNELWLGLVLLSGHLEDLAPQQLAAVVYVLISEPPRPDSWAHYRPSAPVGETLARLSSLRKSLIKCQHRYKVALPVWLEEDTVPLSGIVEQWALEVSWTELCDRTSFDEGDLVRMLRRTVDFLSQIPHVPNLSRSLQDNARRALMLMERFPIQDDFF
ncbi:MAG: DEAD/DEAH box helicase [Spirulinaceae cyanobacterium SM2_1_0]|nr:DEAD/DEAH box helicase [Spirulinaceae cyanobacterium SM2_1_0]